MTYLSDPPTRKNNAVKFRAALIASCGFRMARTSMKIFVAHPYSFKANGYREALSEALNGSGYEPLYADDKVLNMHVLTKIKTMMLDAEFCLFDITGGNFNVGLELGLAIGLEQLAVVAIHEDDVPVLPADVSGWDQLRYSNFNDLAINIRKLCDEGAYKLTSVEKDRARTAQRASITDAEVAPLWHADPEMNLLGMTRHPNIIELAAQANSEGRVYTLVGLQYAVASKRDLISSQERKSLEEVTLGKLTQEYLVKRSAATVAVEGFGEPFVRIVFDVAGLMAVLFGWRKYPPPEASWKSDPFPIEAAILGFELGFDIGADERVRNAFHATGLSELTLGLLNWPEGSISADSFVRIAAAKQRPSATTQGYRLVRRYSLTQNMEAWSCIADFLQYALMEAGLDDFEESLSGRPESVVVDSALTRNNLKRP